MLGEEKLVDVKVLEDHYMVPRTWWYAAAESGRVPSVKVGKYRRFRLSEISAWLADAQQRVEPK